MRCVRDLLLLSILLPVLARRAAAEQPLGPAGLDCEQGPAEFETVRVDGEEVVFLRRGPGCPIVEPEFPDELRETTTVPSTTVAPEGHDTSTGTEEVFAVGHEEDSTTGGGGEGTTVGGGEDTTTGGGGEGTTAGGEDTTTGGGATAGGEDTTTGGGGQGTTAGGEDSTTGGGGEGTTVGGVEDTSTGAPEEVAGAGGAAQRARPAAVLVASADSDEPVAVVADGRAQRASAAASAGARDAPRDAVASADSDEPVAVVADGRAQRASVMASVGARDAPRNSLPVWVGASGLALGLGLALYVAGPLCDRREPAPRALGERAAAEAARKEQEALQSAEEGARRAAEEEASRCARAAAERRAREEAVRLARLEAERMAREAAALELRAREDAARREAEEAEALELRAREEAARREAEEAEAGASSRTRYDDHTKAYLLAVEPDRRRGGQQEEEGSARRAPAGRAGSPAKPQSQKGSCSPCSRSKPRASEPSSARGQRPRR